MAPDMHKPLLMIPGPMDCPDEVLRRCGLQVYPHYDGEFPPFYNKLVEKMKPIFGLSGNGHVFIPNGSGTIAVNMMLASMLTPEDNLLALTNGMFKEYIEKNCDALGVPYTLVEGEWGTAIDPERVRAAMKTGRHRFIYVTHNESSTAMVNPLKPLGEIAREFDALVLVDAVSGVGGIEIDMDTVGVDVVAGASQKCLELPPGLAPVAVGERAWEYMERQENRRVPYILDFMAWRKASIEHHDEHPQPVTGATTMLYALDWMVDRILDEGLAHREERFRGAGTKLKAGMAEYGFASTADPRYESPVVSEFRMPEGILSKTVRDYYRQECDTMVGHGFRTNDNDESISFRIAHFGLAAEDERIDHMIDITRRFMASRT
jgi:aspartate aminotransferase-like enzyme